MRTIAEIYAELEELGDCCWDLTGEAAKRHQEVMAEVERDHGPHAATLMKLFTHYEEEVGSEQLVTFAQVEDILNNLSNQFRSI